MQNSQTETISGNHPTVNLTVETKPNKVCATNRKIITSKVRKHATGHVINKKKTHLKSTKISSVTNKSFDVDETQSSFVTTDSEAESENYFTPTTNRSLDLDDNKDEEDRFLAHLASIMPTITDEEVDRIIEQNKERAKFKSQSEDPTPSSTTNYHQPSTVCTKIQVEMQSNELEGNTSENPTAMSIASVMAMLKDLKEEWSSEIRKSREEEIKEIKKEFNSSLQSSLEQVSANVSQQIKEEAQRIIEEDDGINQVKKDVAYWKLKAETLSDVCGRMGMEIADLTTRIENLELNNSKKMVIISGLYVSGQKEHLIDELYDFFQTALQLNIKIEDAYFLGSITPKSIVITLQTVDDRKQIITAKPRLKNIKQQGRDNKIYINEYLPPTTNEKRRREREVIAMSRPENPEEEHQVSYTAEGLNIKGQVYKKKISVPTPRELVNISPEDLEKIFEMRTKRSADIERSRSIFTAYTAKVQTLQQVRNIYTKVRLVQPEARHVVCAYSLDHPQPFFAQDYQDDQEPGAGRAILQFMDMNNIQNRVVIVARKYGGIRMGNERFQCYVQAAKEAIQADLPNAKLVTKQDLPESRFPMRTRRQNNRNRYRGGYSQRAAPHSSYRGRGGSSNSASGYSYRRNSPTSSNQSRPSPAKHAVRSPRQNQLDQLRGGHTQHTTQTRKHQFEDMDFQFSDPKQINHTPTETWSEDNTGAWQTQPKHP